MKKVLVMLAVMAIAMGVVVAAPGTGEYAVNVLTDARTDKATLEVTLDLGSGSNLGKHYQIGFTSTNVKDYTPAQLDAGITPLKTVALDKATTDGDLTHEEPVYVYWAIKAPKAESENIKLGLSLPGNMTSDTDTENGVKWSVTPEGVDAIATTAVGTAASNDAVKKVKTTGEMIIDCMPITISTVDLRETSTTKEESYSTTLTLSIATVE